MRTSLSRFALLLAIAAGASAPAQEARKTEPRPEMRVYLRDACLINPVKVDPIKVLGFGALAGVFVPRVIEWGLGAIGGLLQKAGAEATEQASGWRFTTMYVKAENEKTLSINKDLACVLGVYGIFEDRDKQKWSKEDKALFTLAKPLGIPENADIDIVFEAQIVASEDSTAMHLDTRHFSVRDFIGDRNKNDRAYAATFAIAAPGASAAGDTIAVGTIDLGRFLKGGWFEPGPAEFPRFRSNLMPWKEITAASAKAYKADVEQGETKRREYMPVAVSLSITETADGNKFLAVLGELLNGAKADAAKALAGEILPKSAEEKAKEESATEALCAAEEDAEIAVRKAEASTGDTTLRDLEVNKAKRALARATRLREAAGLSKGCLANQALK
ncbi:MAG: hypothetical protein SFV54_10545 [Bryobacteraceae bacterium]|nr:hypothetical protein [Bryobacteraceae bacterium]